MNLRGVKGGVSYSNKIMNLGTEWLIDAHGCQAECLRDTDLLKALCERIIRDLDLRVVGEPLWHKFAGAGGVTGIFLLTESHLSCHTYPEVGTATFNLYCCRERPRWQWEENLQSALGARQVTVREILRGNASIIDEAVDLNSIIRVETEREVREL
ncbi:MAG: S-adenosylmethionine decarboxylase [Acidobacteriota bacterium]